MHHSWIIGSSVPDIGSYIAKHDNKSACKLVLMVAVNSINARLSMDVRIPERLNGMRIVSTGAHDMAEYPRYSILRAELFRRERHRPSLIVQNHFERHR